MILQGTFTTHVDSECLAWLEIKKGRRWERTTHAGRPVKVSAGVWRDQIGTLTAKMDIDRSLEWVANEEGEYRISIDSKEGEGLYWVEFNTRAGTGSVLRLEPQ